MKNNRMELNLEEAELVAGGLPGDNETKLARIPDFGDAMKYYGQEIMDGLENVGEHLLLYGHVAKNAVADAFESAWDTITGWFD